ncbi:hypothetical protein CAEBREN_30607 [Caenorhabditis brenneri]|uniref:DUF38 domain-containing protein n=1 Tax=Caenorhabditis brenneri TaxID=135651 RepID=G0NF17_CAEBE|nr:hypothetical protein CAEBREN_30607 [Caenorhabditis brenneri]
MINLTANDSVDRPCERNRREKKVLIEKMDYQNVFFEELDCILKRRKPFLAIFRISLSTVSSQFCGNLRSKIVAKGQVEVQNVSIKAEKQQVFHFLPCISPKYLKRIELCLTKPVVLDVMEFADLDQWNGVKEVFTEGLTFLGPVECFGRFSRVEVTVFKMTVEGLFYLKEKFLTSRNFKQFIIHYQHYADEEASDSRLRIVETRKLSEFFGLSFLGAREVNEKHWYFGIPDSNSYALFFSFTFICSRFVKVPLLSVPQGAI